MTLAVTGGSGGGIAAEFGDLLAAAGLFERLAAEVDALADFAGSWTARLCAESAGPVLGAVLDSVLDVLGGPFSSLRLTAAHLRGNASALRTAVLVYRSHEDGLADDITRAVDATMIAMTTLLHTHSASSAVQAALTADAAGVSTASRLVLFGGPEALLGAHYPDGHPVVHDLGVDAGEFVPPTDLTDLVRQLEVRGAGRPGEISISFVLGADGVRRAIVDVPGTRSWSPGATSDVTSLSTNARALDGASTSYERGVLEAMRRAGVGRTEPVLLVGHSEGGMVAMTAARDAVDSGQFAVTHVITAGSPIARSVESLPSSVQVLALENDADVVPALDGAANPARSNVTTAVFHHDTGRIGANHDLDRSYATGAAECDRTRDASVRSFTDGAEGFLGGRTETTRVFRITRAY